MMTNVCDSKLATPTYEYWLVLILFFSLVSMVMGESRLKLNFPDEFYTQGMTKKKIVRDKHGQEETNDETRNWRSSKETSENKFRWKKIELHYGMQEKRERHQPSDMLHDRFSTHQLELEPQFGVRF
ncbi:hypothetical protein [uncultured Nitrosomonas sp.]|uniref:hypothetical protein n=1 Tax=uncultured Nitrosomonas sp. TaxID=156424 RepID=UPI0025EBFF3F|nr:hypothetical protein [uncultured Nitrosomonas sp.]